MDTRPLSEPRQRSLLWIVRLSPGPNGATLRYLNFAKCLRESGFSIHFASADSSYEEAEKLVQEGRIDGCARLDPYLATGYRNVLSRLLIFPSLRDRLMARDQAPVKMEARALVGRLKADVCIISDWNYVICAPSLAPVTRVVIDWCDSWLLLSWRSLLLSIRSGRWREIPGRIHEAMTCLLRERYYPRLAHANVVVSPVDQRLFKWICPHARHLSVIPNGCDTTRRTVNLPRVKDRLIFSGRMDHPPNYESAIWFIDRVLPLVRLRRPDAHLVIAGANPVGELKARESKSVRVTGLIPDMQEELAQARLCVVPMLSGGGFKNKVVEAIMSGTVIVGTPLAAEFLPAELKPVVLVADNPVSFADTVVRCLEDPEGGAQEIEKAQQFLRLHFTWKARAADLISLFGESDSHRKETV